MMTVRFSCIAKLDPTKARIRCIIKNEQCSCNLLRLEARSEMSPYISCDDIHLEQPPLGSGSQYCFAFLPFFSFGTVYKGTWNSSTVAVKKYNTYDESNNLEAQNFFNFRNEYIVLFKGLCCSLNALVLEFCKYGSVESLFKKGKLTEELKLLICYDCAKGMEVFCL